MELAVPVDGGELWAEDTQADGPVLTFVHPGWGDSGIWSPLLAALSAAPGDVPRYRTIRYDSRGYGRSPAPRAPFTSVGDLRSVLDHLGVPRTSLVAHSGGGGTALGFALAEPERVTSLVLIAPGIEDYPWPRDDPYLAESTRLFDAGDRDGLVALGQRTWAPAGAGPQTDAQLSSAVAAFFTLGGFQRPDPPGYARLGEVRAPAIMIRGDREYPMVATCSDSIAACIPGCQRVVIPGADHMLPLRAPAELAELIAGIAGPGR